MKKTSINWILGLAVMLLSGCGSSSSTSADEQVLPSCSITEGVLLADSQLTVHAVCTGGNVDIDQATVTVDGQVTNLDFTGASIDDYIGFRNLDDNVLYKAELEVIVGGETLTDSVSIRTKKTPTPEPSPEPTPNTPPKWTEPTYTSGVTVKDNTDSTQTIMDLKPVSSDADGDAIAYSIVSISNPDAAEIARWQSSLSINSGVLVVKTLKTNDPDSSGDIKVTIKASAKGGSATTVVKFTFVDTQ